MLGRARRIATLEMAQDVMRLQCATIGYAYTANDITRGLTLDDIINDAAAQQAGYARRCVALPSKIGREDWIAMAQMN